MPRKQHKYHYIYRTTCIINNKFYYGMHSTSNLEDGYLGSGKVLKRSLNKYRKENHTFEITEFLNDRKSLAQKEKEIINESLLKDPLCMNLMIGGGGGFISIENQRNRSIAAGLAFKNKLKNDEEFKIIHSNRSSLNAKKLHAEGKMIYFDWTGRTHKDESKSKMSKKAKLRIGELNSSFGTKWIYNVELKENRKIKLNELDFYLSNNWILGRRKIYNAPLAQTGRAVL